MADLEQLEEKKRQLQNRINREKAKAKTKARKLETRRKIVLGAATLKMLKTSQDESKRAAIMNTLKGYMSERDKALFEADGGEPSTGSPERGE